MKTQINIQTFYSCVVYFNQSKSLLNHLINMHIILYNLYVPTYVRQDHTIKYFRSYYKQVPIDITILHQNRLSGISYVSFDFQIIEHTLLNYLYILFLNYFNFSNKPFSKVFQYTICAQYLHTYFIKIKLCIGI